MKKKWISMLLALSMVSALAACGKDTTGDGDTTLPSLNSEPISTSDGQTTEGQVTADTSSSENLTTVSGLSDVKTILVRSDVDGLKQSYLTGEWKSSSVVNRRPMAVMVPNNAAALPQYGIGNASIIYEAPMEYGSCTRLMCVFEDYDDLDYILPIRSSRLYFLKEAMSLDAIYCNWGLAVAYVSETINSDRVDNISAAVSGISDPSDEAYYRDEDRKAAGYATEYTGALDIEGYQQAVERHGYETNYRERFIQSFAFADDMIITYDEYPDVNVLRPSGSTDKIANGYSNCMPEFIYNPEDRLYYRYEYKEAQVDARTGEQLAVTNVIFKFVYEEYLDDNGYLSLETRGWGDAAVFTSGKYIPATWTAGTDDNDPTYYWTEDGDEIVLNQGKTWVCLIGSDFSYATSFIYDENATLY